MRFRGGRQHQVARTHHVAAPHLVRIQLQFAADLVHRGFQREDDLAESVAAERAGRRGVGVDRRRVDLLVRTFVDSERFVAAVEHDADRVIAICAGVGQHVDRNCGQIALGGGTHPDPDPHRMSARSTDELLDASELQLHRTAGLEHRQQHNVFGEQFLFGAEPAADPGGDDAEPTTVETEDPAQLVPHQERHLRTGPDHRPARAVQPPDRAVRFQMRVLHPRGVEDELLDHGGGGETAVDVTDPRVHLSGDVALAVDHPGLGGVLLAVHLRSLRVTREFRIQHCRQHFVLDDDSAAALLGRGHRLGDHRRDPLPDVPDDGVEHPGVVDVLQPILVTAGGKQHVRRIVGGQHRDHQDDVRTCRAGQ